MKEIDLFDFFPDMSVEQSVKLKELEKLVVAQNSKINLISRKDINKIVERHILHSLSIAKFLKFTKNQKIIDFGTGGGFPGLPLSIFFPKSKFYLIDKVGKKINALEKIVESLELDNVELVNINAVDFKQTADFLISRAVMSIKKTKQLFERQIEKKTGNGFILLKGGDLQNEIREAQLTNYKQIDISKYFEIFFFKTKKIIYIPINLF